jgi:hypothetical protein
VPMGQAEDWLVPISVLPHFRTFGDYMVTSWCWAGFEITISCLDTINMPNCLVI